MRRDPQPESADSPFGPVTCRDCGYDLRGSVGVARCPECGASIPVEDLAPPDPAEIGRGNGIELVSEGLLSTMPVFGGWILLPWLGPVLAVLSAIGLGYRVIALGRLRNGPLAAVTPAPLIRAITATTVAESVPAALVLLLILDVVPAPWLGDAWLYASMAWGVTAAVGVAVLAVVSGTIGRSLGSGWPMVAAGVAIGGIGTGSILGLLTGVLTYGLVPAVGAIPVAAGASAVLAGGLSLAAVLATRVMLRAIEAHVIEIAIEAIPRRVDALLDAPLVETARAEEPPLPLAPARPPVRDDL